MATGLQSWSKTAASNATADSNVNWAEGQSPGSVNNSARAEMASAAMWRDDNAGTITTGGTSTAYTATSNQSLALADGVTVTLQMSATNGASPTLNVDSTGAKAIQKVSGTAVLTGQLLSGGLYTFVYRSSPDAWIVRGLFDSAVGVFASGVDMVFYENTAPTGWTILTASTNDVAVRIVSGSGAGGGTGGALAGTTAFTTVLGARTIAADELPNITMTVTDSKTGTITAKQQTGVFGSDNGIYNKCLVDASASQTKEDQTTPLSVSFSGSISAAIDDTARGSSQQTMDFAVKYASCIIATKD